MQNAIIYLDTLKEYEKNVYRYFILGCCDPSLLELFHSFDYVHIFMPFLSFKGERPLLVLVYELE